MFKLLTKRRYPTGGLWGTEILTEDIMEKVFETSCWSYIVDLNRCLNVFEINNPCRIHHFLSQLGALTNGMSDHKNLHRHQIMRIVGTEQFTYFAEKVQDRRILLGVNGCAPSTVYRGRNYVETAYPVSEAGCWWQLDGMNEVADRVVDNSVALTRAMISRLGYHFQCYSEHDISVYFDLVEKYYRNAKKYITFSPAQLLDDK